MKKTPSGETVAQESPFLDPRRAEELQLDFEISLFETFLAFKPNNIEALFGLGNAYTKRGWYSKGLDMDLRLVRIEPDNPTFTYNLACSYSLLKDVDRSLDALERAIDLGFDDRKQIQSDPDLDNVRSDPRFHKIVASRRVR